MDIGVSLSGVYMVPRVEGGGSSGEGPQGSVLLPGILDADNIVMLGASIMEDAFVTEGTVTPGLQAYATAAGFTGTLQSYAESGNTVSDTIARHATAQADLAATAGNNVYVVHAGGDTVSAQRPYPGGAGDFGSDYTTLLGNITSTSDTVIPLPLTKRLYGLADPNYPNVPGAVVQDDVASEANGSKPYNDAIILPAMATHAPDWLADETTPFVDPYAFVNADTDVLDNDGIHGPGYVFARYVLAQVAGRAMGRDASASRVGTSLIYDLRTGDPRDATIGARNVVQGYPNEAVAPALFYGAVTTNGRFDPHIKTRLGSYHAQTSGMGADAFGRLADTRFHDLDLVGTGIYVQGSETYQVTVNNLTPGDVVTVSCCGVRNASGTNRRGEVTLTGGQSLILDASTSSLSNQIAFAPIPVPVTGRIMLTLSVAPTSTYGYMHGLILDFAT